MPHDAHITKPTTMPLNAGVHSLAFGGVALTLETPPDFESLLDACARETPDAVDRIPYYANLWPSALGLADALAARAPELQGRSLVEFGCGLGLPAILASRLGARPVLATDFHPDAEPWLRRNVARNAAAVSFARLDWNTPSTLNGRRFDWLIGSDLLYERTHIPALVTCITALANPAASLLIADPGRDGLGSFTEALAHAGWQCDLEPRGEIYVVTADRRPLV